MAAALLEQRTAVKRGDSTTAASGGARGVAQLAAALLFGAAALCLGCAHQGVFAEGEEHFRAGRNEQALETFNQFFAESCTGKPLSDPRCCQAMIRIGETYLRENNWGHAARAFALAEIGARCARAGELRKAAFAKVREAHGPKDCQIVVVPVQDTGPSFTLTGRAMFLDDVPVQGDSVACGPHTLRVIFVFRRGAYDYTLESLYSFSAEKGRMTTIQVRVYLNPEEKAGGGLAVDFSATDAAMTPRR